MHVDKRVRTGYPKLASWIYENLPKVPDKPKVFKAFVKFGELTSADAKIMLTSCSPTPVIDYRVMPGANGEFSGATDPNRVYLAHAICEKFEKSPADAKDPRMHLLLESTLLHELVHWGDWKDGKDQAGEEGKAFEKAAYGHDINRYW